jgi:hypothetical protein
MTFTEPRGVVFVILVVPALNLGQMTRCLEVFLVSFMLFRKIPISLVETRNGRINYLFTLSFTFFISFIFYFFLCRTSRYENALGMQEKTCGKL